MSEKTGKPSRRWLKAAALSAAVSIIGGLTWYFFLDDGRFARGLFASHQPHRRKHGPGDPADGRIRVPIFMYHYVGPRAEGMSPMQRSLTVEPEVFESQLRYLKDNGFTVIRLPQLVDSLIYDLELPPKPVVLTFDDGWDCQYERAFPILRKYRTTATFYVVTDYVGHRHFMSWEQLREMDKAGMTIGSHTMNHPVLTKLAEREARRELEGSKLALERALGKPVNDFAYPFGNYDGRVAKYAAEAGYRSARTTRDGAMQSKANLFALRCFEATNSLKEFASDAAGK